MFEDYESSSSSPSAWSGLDSDEEEEGLGVKSREQREARFFRRALQQGQTRFVKQLLEVYPAWATKRIDGRWPIEIAANFGHDSIVRCLARRGASVNDASDNTDTPLSSACQNNHVDIVRYLLDRRANVNDGTLLGTPLEIAFKRDHLAIAEMLLGAGADTHPVEKNPDLVKTWEAKRLLVKYKH